jgi:glycosyltransferase involved in cell wall biosynthesis
MRSCEPTLELASPSGAGRFRWSSPRIALVGTYPPTKCGIATFNASLRHALIAARPGLRVGIVACTDPDPITLHPREVIAQLVAGSCSARADAVAALVDFDAVVVQHEFGIYGGTDGSEVLDLVREIEVPVVVVLHTVPLRPTFGQRAVLEQLCADARGVVVQSVAARDRLIGCYSVAPDDVRVIAHGARLNLAAECPRARGQGQVVLSWGLLGPDKGIEWGIEAIALLRHLDPAPRYVVLGQTHPRILEAAGEAYRDSLVEIAAALGVGDLVEFDNAYHDTASLLARVRSADIVLLPYCSRDQVVSGVLVEALASGKPVVATAFPHAEELLAEGSGLIVPHEDAKAIADALRAYLTEPALAARAASVARRQAQTLRWEAVAESYLSLIAEVADRAVAPRRRFPAPRFEHLLRRVGHEDRKRQHQVPNMR